MKRFKTRDLELAYLEAQRNRLREEVKKLRKAMRELEARLVKDNESILTKRLA